MFHNKKTALVTTGVLVLVSAVMTVFASQGQQSKIEPRFVDSISHINSKKAISNTVSLVDKLKTQKFGIGGSVVVDYVGVELDVDSDRGWFDLEFNDLPALTDARFMSGNPGTLKTITRPGISRTPVGNSSSLNLDLTNTFAESAPVTKQIRIYARARTDNSLGRAEVLVTKTDGTIICQQVSITRADAICDTTVSINLVGGGAPETFTYKAYASNSGDPATTSLSGAIIDDTDTPVSISGPTKAGAFEPVKARFVYNHRVINRVDQQIRFVRVYSAPNVLVRELPVITRWNGRSYAAMPLLSSPGALPFQMSTTFADREVVDRVFVDVPVNAQSVTFRAQSTGITPASTSGVPQDIDLYLSHPVLPNANSVVPAEPINSATLSSINTSATSESITLTNPSPGRWYVIGKSKYGERMGMRMSTTFNSFSAAPNFQFGHYYNPARSGHGVYIDKVAGEWVLLWYTYLQDGTPTWYIAEGVAPGADQGNSIWEASLKRVVWNGSSQFYYTIGSVRVVLLGETSFQFNYIVDGEAGGETFTRLGRPGCTNSAGRPFDVSGVWYSPSKPGFGYSAEVIANQEFIPAYLYDENGMPRWLVGEKAFVDGLTTMNMEQLSGFCPLCTYRAPSSKVVGTLSRTLSPTASPDNLPGYGTMGVSANFAWPLRGSWNQNLPVTMLADRKACK
jgi:hypothetical protein